MRTLFPPITPYREHRLAVDALHTLHIEECGNPEGIPAVFLHGGPGAGVSPTHRRFFDPARYRIVLIDQRGSGRSTPFGELRDNTTQELVADIEKVREHLGIARGTAHMAMLAHGHVGHSVAARLLRQEVGLAPSGREAHDPETLGIVLDDVEGLAPDRARAAEDDDVSSLGHAPIVLRSSL